MEGENKKRYARRFGDTVASGEMDVTVNGQTVKASGKDLGNMAAVTAGIANLRNRNTRAELNENNGNVMLGGTDTGVKASDFAGGADDKSLERLRTGYIQNSGDDILRARYAAESKGLGNLVRWDGSANKMTIAGIDVPYLYITDDGNAMVSKRTLDKVMEQVKNSAGVKTASELAQELYNKHSRGIDRALDKVTNRKEWSYNPESDPAYQAYAKEYLRNAEQMYNRAMGSGGLYGSPNSYQMYQALAGYGDNMQRMSDKIPQLQAAAYERYSDEQTRNLDALAALQSERSAEFNLKNTANESQLNRMGDNDEANYKRYEDSIYNYPLNDERLEQSRIESGIARNEKLQSDMDTDMHQALLDVDYKIRNAELDQIQVKTLLSNIQAAQERAMLYNGGMFMKQDMDALGIPRNMAKYPDTGGYPSPWDAEINAKIAEWTSLYQYGIAG